MKRSSLFIVFLLITGLATITSAQEENQAGLVITLEDGSVLTRCVNFVEPEITGLELLGRAEVDLVTSIEFRGATVCSLGGQGCPAENCFCQCQGNDCVYWSYWHLQEEGWKYSVAGASVSTVTDGDVDGWTFGPGTPQDAPEPPALTLADICTAPVELPATTPVVTSQQSPPLSQDNNASGNGIAYLNLLYFAVILLVLGGFLLLRKGRKT